MTSTMKDLLTAMKGKARPEGFDTPAQVVRVEGQTVWVHIPGGVTETPVRKTIDCAPGDTVHVRVSGGSATLTGNETTPPTGDSAAIAAATEAGLARIRAAAASAAASSAALAAAQAQAEAESKTRNYVQSEPPQEGVRVGDTWTDIDDQTIYTWDGTDWVQTSNGEDGEDAALIYIHSSAGTAFKNNTVETVLTVTIYYGPRIITDQTGLTEAFGAGAYLLWSIRMYGSSSFIPLPASDPRLTDSGFTFTITPSDVNVQCVFNVQIICPD